MGAADCYFTADLTKPDNTIGVAFGYKVGEGDDNIVTVELYLDACHQSLVRQDKIQEADPVAPCVLGNGQVGIFPGTDDVCATLNLPVAARTAATPIPS